MLTREKMKGIYALSPTPYTKDGVFDEEVFRSNTRKLCAAGVHGVVINGTVGEFYTISWEDHQRQIKALVEETKKLGKYAIAGCSGVNTREAIKKTMFAQACGADAVMNIIPFYQVLNRNEIVQYFQELASACPDIGIIVYNNQFTGRVLIDADIFVELEKIPNLIGSKETNASFTHWTDVVKVAGLTFMHIDRMLVPGMMWGGKGSFSYVACVQPELILAAYKACEEGNWQEAKMLQYRVNDLLAIYSGIKGVKQGGDPSAFKAFVEAAGFLQCGGPGKPYFPVDPKEKDRLKKELQAFLTR